MRDKVTRVTKYHLSRFPPVKQMLRYWSVHTIVQEGLVLNFVWLSRNSDAALMPGLHRVSERGLCWCGGRGFYLEAWLLQTRPKILGISLTNFTDSHAQKGYIAPLEEGQQSVAVNSAICSQSYSPLPIVLPSVIHVWEDFVTLGSFWHLSSSARKFSHLCIGH